jgi:WXG100 family type VII secretion target
MPNQFDQNAIQQYGGVEWAKQQIDALDPSAIQSQIDGYNQVNTSLNQIVQTLNSSNASLQSAWQGDAATAATQSFTEASNHTQNVVTTVTNTISQLNQAKTAAEIAQSSMSTVPNEKPVPAGNWFTDGISDIFTGTDPVKQAQQHNTAARTQAADVLNQLSTSYDSAATNLTSISGGKQDQGFTPTAPPSTGSYNLGAGSYGGGTGAARGYDSSTGVSHAGTGPSVSSREGGVTNGVFEDTHTSIQGLSTYPPETVIPGPESGLPGPNPVSTPNTPVFGIGGPISEPIGEPGIGGSGGGMFGDGGAGEPNNLSGRSKVGSSGLFGEEGFDGEGGSISGRGSGLGGSPAAEGEGIGAGAIGEGQGQSGMRGAGGARRGGGAGGGDEEELGSSRYSRGRYFGGEEAGAGRDEWVQPSVGGDESLIVRDGSRGSGTGRVTSAYDGATDADGNPIGHRMGFGGRRGGSSDEDEERGERPAYLKEDPEWWKSAQKVAPPVIE